MNEREAIALLENMAGMSGPFASGIKTAKSPQPTDTDGVPSLLVDSPRKGWQPDLRYRSLVEKLPVVTFMASLDETQQELYISPQIESLLGFTQTEWLEDPFLWFRQLHPDDREQWISEFARTCAMGTHFRAEYRLLARDGHIVWIQGECQIIRDDDGRPIYLQGIAFDISHIKRAAEDQEARLAAQAASEAKSQFLARMSHEIRTPLNGVVGMIDLLKSTEMTAAQERYVHLAREAAGSLLTVINDILDFSKIEAGKVEIESIDFDVHKLVEDITELLGPVAAKKNLALASLIRPDVPRRAVGDPNRIRQVLTNLINNAMKFTKEGSVTIRAALEGKDDHGSTLRVQVEDTGIGIPADRLDRLFKSFSQVDSSTTRKFGGTGLGLVISKQLVELMGGQIGIESQEGRGTTFWFTLKFAPSTSDPAQTAEQPSEILRNVRVLAVESHPTYRRILAEQLDGRLSPASAVLSIEDSLPALQNAAAEGKPFSILLLPYGTPEGVQLANAIHADARLQNPKLIAVLDIDDRTETSDITQAGFFARLHRPLTQSRLFDTLASAMSNALMADSSSLTTSDAPMALKGLNLLVAEDNEMNQFVTQETLRRVECTCDIVSDGQLAVDASQRQSYDAILMDCQMPGMDGLEATRHIRQREATTPGSRRIPIIALTAEAIQGDREKCLAAGMDGYVTKPINPEELFEAIRTVLAGAAAAPVAIAPLPTPVETTPIDVESLLSRCMSDAAFAIQTLQKFQQRAIGDVELLRQGIAAGDIDKTTRLAHNLKSVAAHTGAGPLRKIAFEIEQAGIRRDLQFMSEQLTALDLEARRCASFVPDAMKQLNPALTASSNKAG
ncbi:MAG TPA: ATP-binding protein [Tepidisphaeraceae bacterium]|nr:ATP-binding protein [Tepidisphaeraceae bacterium]